MAETRGRTDRPLVAVAILASFVAFLDGSVVNLALPAINRDFGGGLALQQWVVDGYLLTLGALILVAGAISDTFGRLVVLRMGLGAFAVSSLLCAVAPSGWVLVAARCLQGVGAAFLVPSSLAMINARFSGLSAAKFAHPAGPEGEHPGGVRLRTQYPSTATDGRRSLVPHQRERPRTASVRGRGRACVCASRPCLAASRPR